MDKAWEEMFTEAKAHAKYTIMLGFHLSGLKSEESQPPPQLFLLSVCLPFHEKEQL